MENKYLKDHKKIKKTLRIVGFICSIAGLFFIIVGISDFFSDFNHIGFPPAGSNTTHYPFIGIPLLFIGLVCLMFGYMNAFASFAASQSAPVTKDVTNYLLDGTRKEIKKTTQEIAKTFFLTRDKTLQCSECETFNEVGSRYCEWCGKPLTLICPQCQSQSENDAQFCRKCGEKLD